MCRCPEMESYEEFCLRSAAALRDMERTCEPLWAPRARSVIRFYGRAVLSPLLSAEQHCEMCGHKRRAVQLEANRQKQQGSSLLTRVQDTLAQAQAHEAPSEEADKPPVSKSVPVTGYTLVTDSPGLPRDPACGRLRTNDQPASPSSETPILNGYNTAKEVEAESEEKSDEEEEEEDDISLDSLLKRSQEYVKREQSQPGSKVVHAVTRTPPPQTASDKENNGCSPIGGSGVEFGFSLHHSPVGLPQTPLQRQTPHDSSPQKSACLSPSLPERYPHLPIPESSVSPRPHRRKPRPVSTGNIPISFPFGPSDLIPRNTGRSGEGAGRVESPSGTTEFSDSAGCEGVGGISRSGDCRSSPCCTTPLQESRSLASASSSKGHYDHLGAGFRRRCHTLDSQLHSYHCRAEHIDRSQERAPRFMAGVTWMPPSRRTPAVILNRSYEVDNPSPSLLRPGVACDLPQVALGMDPEDPQGTNVGRITASVLKNAADAQASKTEEVQRRAQALEDMQRRLEEDHALQMSLLLAEQQRLHLEFQETERRLKEQGCARQSSGDACGWTCRSVSDCGPVVSPSCPGLSPACSPSKPSPGHNKGFPSPDNSRVSSPSAQPPIYLLGPSWAVSKPRARLSLVLTAEQQGAFCRIGAIIRGFLTRRLLTTEKVRHLRQTILDTQEFIRSFQTEPQNLGPSTAQDHCLQERVRAQLCAALYDIHDIFFEMPLGDRLALLQQDRELQAERKLRDLGKNKCPKEKVILSAATQRSLDRKKRVAESPAQARKIQQKPKSPTTSRVLKSSQGQNSPIPGQLNRQGSWYRRTPEERVRRSDSLKKQHSLG